MFGRGGAWPWQGRNRQIRKMMEAIGNRVVELHRTRVLGISLSGLEGAGDWLDLNEFEMEDLRAAILAADEQQSAASV